MREYIRLVIQFKQETHYPSFRIVKLVWCGDPFSTAVRHQKRAYKGSIWGKSTDVIKTHLLKIHFKPYDNVLITSAGVSCRYYPADVLKTSVGDVSWYCVEGNMGTFLERRFLFNWIVKLDSDNKQIHNLFEFCWLLIPALSRENSLVPLQEVVFATSDLT